MCVSSPKDEQAYRVHRWHKESARVKSLASFPSLCFPNSFLLRLCLPPWHLRCKWRRQYKELRHQTFNKMRNPFLREVIFLSQLNVIIVVCRWTLSFLSNNLKMLTTQASLSSSLFPNSRERKRNRGKTFAYNIPSAFPWWFSIVCAAENHTSDQATS